MSRYIGSTSLGTGTAQAFVSLGVQFFMHWALPGVSVTKQVKPATSQQAVPKQSPATSLHFSRLGFANTCSRLRALAASAGLPPRPAAKPPPAQARQASAAQLRTLPVLQLGAGAAESLPLLSSSTSSHSRYGAIPKREAGGDSEQQGPWFLSRRDRKSVV